MELTLQQRNLFQAIYDAPIDSNFRQLTPELFPYFVAYLFDRDGTYVPTVTEAQGHGGDGNVDIELRARMALNPPLLGVVQCKLFRINLGPKYIKEFSTTVRHLQDALNYALDGYFFTGRGYGGGAYDVARKDPPLRLMDFEKTCLWIQQMRTRDHFWDHLPPKLNALRIPVICFANNKGGVGKTTLTVNLADAFARKGLRVLVIDADPQCNTTKQLLGKNIAPPEDSSLTIQGVIEDGHDIYHLIQTRTVFPNVSLLPCHGDFDKPSRTLTDVQVENLARAFGRLPMDDFPIDIILIDTQPALSPLTRAAIIASNYVVLPLQTDEFSFQGIGKIAAFIDSSERLHGVNVRLLGGIATVVDTSSNTSRKYLKTIAEEGVKHQRVLRENLTNGTFWVAQTRQYVAYKTAQEQYTSVINLQSKSEAAKDIVNVAERIIEHVNSPVLVHA